MEWGLAQGKGREDLEGQERVTSSYRWIKRWLGLCKCPWCPSSSANEPGD